MNSLEICPQCGFDNRVGSKFCGQCGSLLVDDLPAPSRPVPPGAPLHEYRPVAGSRCQHCGAPNDEDAKVCARCGARLLIECPQCGALNKATVAVCAHCGFEYSRFVAQRVIDELDRREGAQKESAKAGGLSSGFMIVLVIFSILIAIYILRQI